LLLFALEYLKETLRSNFRSLIASIRDLSDLK
jgi:hypothetical protein